MIDNLERYCRESRTLIYISEIFRVLLEKKSMIDMLNLFLEPYVYLISKCPKTYYKVFSCVICQQF